MFYRSFSLFFLVIFFLTITTINSFSEFRFRDGNKIEIQWYEQEGAIIDKHVCFNYKEDDRKFRQCRKKAVDYFAEECKFYKDKIKTTPRKYKKMYEPDMNKFCGASESYRP
jgi:hypothetical protein